ncbi:beta-carotene 15,15'-monooxygenase [Finegoldia sp. BIOML-A2]|uniref:beta-carotene 15,15'-monooxygenase n=1 Tax=unclassified Finegoldia TaxID=2619637 RepID=UPI0012B0772C|nr:MULTISPECIES: beta-carotene 15,15'-monooxygenase [unclassified Finegoldia]MSA98003.1 beta-carotene 15,15'-monooxygenase [Finegoldia sp. BIOML-A5]MSB01381.1 beta-carotene 15,15'-monooxygenase [Finegoldia sp. BIOML-A2]
MSDDRDYKGFENDDNEYTKDGNYFNEKEEVKGSYSEDKDSYSDRNSNYFESSQEENYSNVKQDHYEKTDDSFFFEGQDDEEEHIEDYTQRQSSGYAGFCQKVFSLLHGLIENFNKKGAFVILFLLYGVFTFVASIVQYKLHPETAQQLQQITKSGLSVTTFTIIISAVSVLFYFVVCRIIFHFTKKDMSPVPNPVERDTRLGVYVAVEALINILMMVLPTTVLPSIVGMVVGVVLYSSVFYDRISDERMLAVGVKSAIVSIVAGLVFGLIIAVGAIAVVVSVMK